MISPTTEASGCSSSALPSSVRVLTTADGSVGSTPVEWEALPPGATDSVGELSVVGTTALGEVTAMVDVVEAFSGFECDNVVTGRHVEPMTISGGVTCLEGATVTGPVSVKAGAGLQADGSRITGPVTAQGAAVVTLYDTRVTGPVRLNGGSSVTLGNPVLDCAPNSVVGPVKVTNTDGWNVIAGNSIIGPLACSGNAPPQVNNGSTNSVLGPKTGQCSGL
ncbi:MAG: hypothetical protein ACRDWI_13395 [Jiangellaceae bacterium]